MASSVGPFYAVQGRLEENILWIDSQGIAYEVEKVSRHWPASAEQSVNWIYLAEIIKEDARELFAFSDSRERLAFVRLRNIDGLGSRFAATAIRELGLGGLKTLLTSTGSAQSFVGKVPGLGPKTLDKMRLGMQQARSEFEFLLEGSSARGEVQSQTPESGFSGEAPSVVIQALIKLGLRLNDAQRAWEAYQKQKLDGPSANHGAEVPSETLKKVLQVWGQLKGRGVQP